MGWVAGGPNLVGVLAAAAAAGAAPHNWLRALDGDGATLIDIANGVEGSIGAFVLRQTGKNVMALPVCGRFLTVNNMVDTVHSWKCVLGFPVQIDSVHLDSVWESLMNFFSASRVGGNCLCPVGFVGLMLLQKHWRW
jgi:hypothetical protein